MAAPKGLDQDLAALVLQMTVEEKASLLNGNGMWRSQEIKRLGIPAIVMTDGTHGVRYSITQIDKKEKAGQDIDAFLAMVNQKANEVEASWGTMKPATCFPNGSSVACSWDMELVTEMGTALGVECRTMGIDMLLGPGLNIRRTPLGGRVYEYPSEDPIITGDFAAAVINGVQGCGVGTAPKHFACNNNEVERTTMDMIVEERALREIFLRGFERAIRKSKPWTVMSSYNRLNGAQVSEDPWLLTEVLRGEWGFDGMVISDWNGVKDGVNAVAAGNDLSMPESLGRYEHLLAGIKAGTIPIETVDLSCRRVLELIRKCEAAKAISVPQADHDAHHRLARRIAGESNVLLKNAKCLLPLASSTKSIAVIGPSAVEAVIQGSGCATIAPTRVESPLEEIRALAGSIPVQHYQGTGRSDALEEAVSAARGAEVAVIFANTEVGWDGEGSDRSTLDLAEGQDALIKAVSAVSHKTVVIVSSPDAVAMPWIDDVSSVLATFFSGQAMGGAVADILFGKVNPSGKLTTTFPRAIEQIPSYLTYPGENGRHVYSEGVNVGYRTYDSINADVLFPFGHGLSYSTFEYSDLTVDKTTLLDGQELHVSFSLKNTSQTTGAEVTQVYARYGNPRVRRPRHELKAYRKTVVPAGSTVRVELTVSAEDLCYWDPPRHRWILDNDDIVLEVGSSSRDIRLEAQVATRSPVARYREILVDTQPAIILDTPIARAKYRTFFAERLSISEDGADQMLEHVRSSFWSLLQSLDRRLRQKIAPEEVQALLDEINAEIKAQEEQGDMEG